MRAASDDAASQVSLSGALATALSELDLAGVRWCLLRGAAELERGQDDVDLLVHPADLATLGTTVARAAGFAPLPAWGRAPHRFFVVVEPRVKLDVVSGLAFGRHGELRTDDSTTGLVLARRRRRGALNVPARDDALWALLLHAILDRRVVRPERAAEIQALASEDVDGSPLASVVDAACPPGWSAARVREAAGTGSFDELLELAPALRARWPGAGRPRLLARVALSAALRRADRARLVRAWRAHGGVAQQSGLIASNSRLRSTG